MPEWSRKMRIDGKQTRKRLAINALAYAHHHTGELELIFPTATMFDSGN